MRALGRSLQFLGLVLLPTGFLLAQGTMQHKAMTVELGFLAFGAAIFWIGLKIQGGR